MNYSFYFLNYSFGNILDFLLLNLQFKQKLFIIITLKTLLSSLIYIIIIKYKQIYGIKIWFNIIFL